MLQEIEFIKWCKDNGMSDLAQQLINRSECPHQVEK